MRKKLFNVHKKAGLLVVLLFYISLLFGIYSIFLPYIAIWEKPSRHFAPVVNTKVAYDACYAKVQENPQLKGKNLSFFVPNAALEGENALFVYESKAPKNHVLLHPSTCEELRERPFHLDDWFISLHRGANFGFIGILLFGFMSIGLMLLALSGSLQVLRTKYSDKNPKRAKTFFAKYHRKLSLYALPLLLMFAITGALFNLGLYASPLVTLYLTKGETSNPLVLEKNIISNEPLELSKSGEKAKMLSIKALQEKAQKAYPNLHVKTISLINWQDSSAAIKFEGAELEKVFVNGKFNDPYVLLEASSAKVLELQKVEEGLFSEKFLDALFYLHYLPSFPFFARFVFVCLNLVFLVGTAFSLNLWLTRHFEQSKKTAFFKHLSFSVVVGLLFVSAMLFLANWVLPSTTSEKSFEWLFYGLWFGTFLYSLVRQNLFKASKELFLASAGVLVLAVFAHGLQSGFFPWQSLALGMKEVFIMDMSLLITAFFLGFLALKLPKRYFTYEKSL